MVRLAAQRDQRFDRARDAGLDIRLAEELSASGVSAVPSSAGRAASWPSIGTSCCLSLGA